MAANSVAVTSPATETSNQTFSLNQNLRSRDVETLNYSFGGETKDWGRRRLDFRVNFSPFEGTGHRFIPQRSTAGVGFRQDRSQSRDWAKLTQISGPDIDDVKSSTVTSVDLPEVLSRDKIAGAQVNFSKPRATVLPVTLKTGARFREQTRQKDRHRHSRANAPPSPKLAQIAAAILATQWQAVGWKIAGGERGKLRLAWGKVWCPHGRPKAEGKFKKLWMVVDWPAAAAEPHPYYLAYPASTTTKARGLALSRSCWYIDQYFQSAKADRRLDHFEDRSWTGFIIISC